MPAGTSRRQRLQVTTNNPRVDGPWNIPEVKANIWRISGPRPSADRVSNQVSQAADRRPGGPPAEDKNHFGA